MSHTLSHILHGKWFEKIRRKRLFFWLVCLASTLLMLYTSGCDYETQEERIKPQEDFVESVDVLVLGDAFSGMITAWEAARNGAKVMVIAEENSSKTVDFAEGIPAFSLEEQAGNAEQGEPEEELLEDTWDSLHEDFRGVKSLDDFERLLKDYGNRQGSLAHLRNLAENSAYALEWLEKTMDVNYSLQEGWSFRYMPEEEISMDEAKEELRDRLRSEGVVIDDSLKIEHLQSTSLESYQLEVKNRDEVKGEIFTRSIIFAGGGYLGEEDIMGKVAPDENLAPWRINESNPFIYTALEKGYATTQLDTFRYALMLKEEEIKLPFLQGGAWNEGWLISSQGVLPLAEEISTDFTEKIADVKCEKGLFLLVEKEKLSGEHSDEEWIPYFDKQDGVQELEENYKDYQLDTETLSREVADRQTFKIAPVEWVADYCLGGLQVDSNYRVLQEGRPVERIYAVGETVGGLWGDDAFPGSNLLEKIIVGKEIGQHAAQASTK